ncbi:MAG: hypothetical protein M1832_002207 [Thelocarpon impressellum]|nr:MAG: hypothetical protein M1832_002207 [Thelocarpon impressellum]
MAPAQLSPPGSSSYSSSSMTVGDGTWDAQRNSFLLPNLVGLNFETMRYNGMGNRFAGLPQYHTIVRGHGIVAAVTFLFIVPAAIMIARFYHRRPYWALRLHIWLQIITVVLSTVIFALGWFAVGPKRSLTNPHHGIGLAIYVLILTQAIGGWWVHGREKGKARRRIPVKLMLHQWFGRFIALLGIVQVALGLTLYGSPRYLFVLYALTVFTLILIYFILCYHEGGISGLGGPGSMYSDSEVYESRSERRDHHGGKLKTLAGVGAAGAALVGINKLRHRSRSRSRASSRRGSGPRVNSLGSRAASGSYIEEEKHHGKEPGGGGWKDRLLKLGATAGAAGLAKNFLDKKRDRNLDRRQTGRPVELSGSSHSDSEESLSRLEAGQSPGRVHRPRPTRRRSGSFSSISSRTSINGRKQGPGHKIRDGVTTLGALGLVRAAFKGRRERKEQRRVDEVRERERENERIARRGSQAPRYTGDGFPRRGGRRGSLTASTDITGVTESSMHPGPRIDPRGAPRVPGAPPPPAGFDPQTGRISTTSGVHMPIDAGGPIPMPAGPTDPRGLLHQDISGSESYVSAGGHDRRRHHLAQDATAAAAIESSHTNRHHRGEGSAASPPMAVKVKLHNDNNRHVTLRRLTEEERVAEQEARRRDRQEGKRLRRRRDNDSDFSGTEGGDRWRRTGTAPQPVPGDAGPSSYAPPQAPAPAAGQTGYLPPPPHISAASQPAPGSVGSPGTFVSDVSTTDAASRRQRRRAERAQQGYNRPAGTVDYT